ncbi:MAG: N-acetyltransferase [Xanthomonadales bacterium]|nr:N-acetyltransferase [Gammaproteobacteria bacterium]MBT8052675.1 N-acetyltransferase [Gammaproteobacteria bacterium]NND56804.1 N-acetyltransferase [Xanthomonadales bacterium]NNK50667.1 N-acetyltransferase [Xanthomonadales bacterium]
MNHPDVEIREVLNARDLKAFIAVPWSIYRTDQNWVPPLKIERKEAFSGKNPYFLHARWKAWIAYRGGEPVGRISAQIDDLYLQRHDPHTGFFGLLEAPDDPAVFAALFEAAETWLRSEGMRSVLGPFNLSINQEIGCLVEGFDSPPYVMMGHAPVYYGPAIEARGYGSEQDVLAYELSKEDFKLPATVQKLLGRLSDKMHLRQVDRKNIAAELEILRDIFNDAWSENWGFVPFTSDEFQAVGKEMFMIVPPEFTLIAETDGKPAAFIVLIPNLNEAIADLNGKLFPFGWAKLLWRLKVRAPETGRIALMGVRKEYQHTRLGPALAFLVMGALYKPAVELKMEKVEMSWILEQNQAMRNIIEKVGGVITKRYRMYRKEMV